MVSGQYLEIDLQRLTWEEALEVQHLALRVNRWHLRHLRRYDGDSGKVHALRGKLRKYLCEPPAELASRKLGAPMSHKTVKLPVCSASLRVNRVECRLRSPPKR